MLFDLSCLCHLCNRRWNKLQKWECPHGRIYFMGLNPNIKDFWPYFNSGANSLPVCYCHIKPAGLCTSCDVWLINVNMISNNDRNLYCTNSYIGKRVQKCFNFRPPVYLIIKIQRHTMTFIQVCHKAFYSGVQALFPFYGNTIHMQP